MEGEQSSVSAQGGKQEIVEKLSTRINGLVEESDMLGDMQGVSEWGEGQMITILC